MSATTKTAAPGARTTALRLTPEDRTALDTYLLRLEQLQKTNDWRGLLSLMAEGCVVMPPRHTTMDGRKAWLDWVEDRSFEVEDLTLRPTELDGSGDLAFVRCNYRWTYRLGDRAEPVVDSGKFLSLLRRQVDDHWLATHWIWTSDLHAHARG